MNTENAPAISIQADLCLCMAIRPSFLHKGWESMCKICEIQEAEIVCCSGKISNPSLLHSCQSRSDDSDGMKTKRPPKITSCSSSIVLRFVYKWSRSLNSRVEKKRGCEKWTEKRYCYQAIFSFYSYPVSGEYPKSHSTHVVCVFVAVVIAGP